MTGWRVIDLSITNSATVVEVRGGWRVTNSSGPQDIPLSEVSMVLVGGNVSLPGAALITAAEYKVPVLFCDWRGIPVSASTPWSDHTRVGARQRAQAESSRPLQKQIWKRLVSSKISGQGNVLKSHNPKGAQRLAELAHSVKSGDEGNLEGVAAAYYWRRYIPGFVRDRTSGDPVNSALNYGYTVLRGHAIRAVIAAGLHPGWGVFHHNHANPMSLADDLIEPFRPAVDSMVLRLLPDLDMSDRLIRQELVSASETAMGNGYSSAAVEMISLAQHIGACFEGNGGIPAVPRWQG